MVTGCGPDGGRSEGRDNLAVRLSPWCPRTFTSRVRRIGAGGPETRPGSKQKGYDVNRQTKRLMAKQEAQRKAGPRAPVRPSAAPQRKERTKPREFVREVIAELKKVAWPSRQEVIGYSIVVFVSAVVIAAMIFGMDLVFAKGILALFGVDR